MKSKVVEAVLEAANEWVAAQEALVAAQQISEETEAEQEVVDIAGSRLVLAVTRWRSSRSNSWATAHLPASFKRGREGNMNVTGPQEVVR
jgi:hypothetical protein